MAGHAQLKFVMTECLKTQIHLMCHIRYWLFSVQEASRIRTEAENTKKRAVDLKDNADLLAEDVADTDDQIVNLNVQAESDSELATEV